jgi:hypothetical protein
MALLGTMFGLLFGGFFVVWGVAWIWNAPGIGDAYGYQDDTSDDPEERAGTERLATRRVAIAWRLSGVGAIVFGLWVIVGLLGIDVGSVTGVRVSAVDASRLGWGILGAIFTAIGIWVWRNTDRLVRSVAREPPIDVSDDLVTETLHEGPGSALINGLFRLLPVPMAIRLSGVIGFCVGLVFLAGIASPAMPDAFVASLTQAESIVELVAYAIATVLFAFAVGGSLLQLNAAGLRNALAFSVGWLVLVVLGYATGLLDGPMTILGLR